MGDKGKNISNFCHDAAQLMFKMIGFIINLAPLAVFGLMAWVAATLGVDALLQLGKLVIATITGMAAQYIFLVLCFIFILRLNPWPFMQKSLEYQMIAFSTSSSKATLATSMDVAERKLGVSKPINSFILPLGAAVNMDGTAIYLGISALFFAQAYGVDLHMYHYCLIIFTSTIAAVGAAGYPGGSLIVMTLVLTSIGVPTEGIALLVGVDRILDMFRTTINITSDVAITAFIDRTEGSFNEKIYYTPNDKIHDEVIGLPKKKPAAKAAPAKASVKAAPAKTAKKAPAKKKK
jgi:Na+/H+-dicarboxylate symporter